MPPTHYPRPQQQGIGYCRIFYGDEQKRKMSYDEDVFDYELSDDDDADDDGDNNKDEDEVNKDDFDAKEAYLQLKRYAARQRKSKEVTPESDYASECNYPQKGIRTNGQDAMDNEDVDIEQDEEIAASSTDEHDNDGKEKSSELYEELNLSLLKIPFGQVGNESDIEECNNIAVDGKNRLEVDNDDDDDGDDDDDFLTTTFTWNLRKKSRQEINVTDDNDNDDDDDVDCGDNNNHGNSNLIKRDNALVVDEDEDKFVVEQQTSLNKANEILKQKQYIKADTPEKDQKLDKLERSWPWADREKIIYKQSTCHLVPHKPLGLIEQRIQLLAKRNLLEHINKIRNPQ